MVDVFHKMHASCLFGVLWGLWSSCPLLNPNQPAMFLSLKMPVSKSHILVKHWNWQGWSLFGWRLIRLIKFTPSLTFSINMQQNRTTTWEEQLHHNSINFLNMFWQSFSFFCLTWWKTERHIDERWYQFKNPVWIQTIASLDHGITK